MPNRMCALLSDFCRNDVSVAGGKGANLGDMLRAGLPVPPGFVICAQAYRDAVMASGLRAQIEDLLAAADPDSADQLRVAETEIRGLFDAITINSELRRSIVERYHALRPDANVAVRSSATAEDLAGASFAGQQETILNVRGSDSLIDAVQRCWYSLYTAQAIFYRHRRGFREIAVSMAVVVQEMLNADKSGVLFTIDPVLRNPYNMVIEAVWGLGEGLVSGALTPDHYKLDRDTFETVYEFIPEKQTMFRRDDDGGVAARDVPAKKASARVLSTDELKKLVEIGNRVESHFGCPQDIEWGIEDGQVYMLQSRPITGI